MKKRILFLLLTMILIISDLTGCQATASSNQTQGSADTGLIESIPSADNTISSGTATSTTTETNAADSSSENSSAKASSTGTATDCYQAILKNEMTFVDTNNNNTPSYLNEVHYSDDVTCTPKQYAMVDFDGDGEQEVCVEMDLGFDSEFIVLHYYDGTVYGYSFPYRGMMSLSENGCYIGSDGAAYSYIFSLSFNGSDYVEKTVAYSDLDDNATAIYFNENKESISETEFNSLFDSVQAAPVNWTAF